MTHAATTRLARRACQAIFALLALLPAMWIPISLFLPLGRDQGIFAWAGQVVLRGGLPYVDAWEVKGPFVSALYAVALAIFGESEMAVRIMDVVFLVAMLAAYFRLSKLLGSKLAGWLSFAIAFYLFGTSFWERAQPDGWAAALLLWMTVLVLSPGGRLWSLALAGGLLGMSALVKPNFILFGAVLLVREVAGREPGSLRRIAVFSLAAAAPIVAVVAFYAARGELQTFLDVHLFYNIRSHAGMHGTPTAMKVLESLVQLIAGVPNVAATLFAGVGGVLLWKQNRTYAAVLATAVAIGLLEIALQNKWYVYHSMPYFALLAALAGYGLARVYDYCCESADSESAADAISSPPRPTAIYLVLPALLLMAMPLGTGLFNSARLWKDALLAASRGPWDRNFIYADFDHSQIAEAAEFIRAHTEPDDRVYLWGFDSLLIFLADRPPASRFGFNYALIVGSQEYIARYRAELMEQVTRQPPRVIAVQKRDANNLMPKSSDEYLGEFRELQDFIAERYAPQFENESFTVYLAK